MKLKFTIGLLIIWIVNIQTIYAQLDFNTTQEIVTPSPTVAKLGEYGGVQLKKTTGGVHKSIPLFKLKQGIISYNPSVDYFSTGIRVDEWGGRLGIGWNDNFTAIIQRNVNSVPDEYATQRFNYVPGYFQEFNYDKYLELASLEAHADQTVGTGSHDGEYDLFSFNIFGHNGQFIVVNNQAILLTHNETIDVDISSFGIGNIAFCVTDISGFKYYFNTEVEYTELGIGDYITTSLPTAWFLSKIESPQNDTLNFIYSTVDYACKTSFYQNITYKNGLEEGYSNPEDNDDYILEFDYNLCDFSYGVSRKHTQTKCLTSVVGSDFELAFDYISRDDLVGEKLINKITLYNDQHIPFTEVNFQYDNYLAATQPELELYEGDDLYPWDFGNIKKRYFLKSISKGSFFDKQIQVHNFSYNSPENLPHRFSLSQDEGGYFNGIANTMIIPKVRVKEYIEAFPTLHNFPLSSYTGDRRTTIEAKAGILSKIEYPTRGYDIIEYDLNSYTTTVVTKTKDFISEEFHNLINEGPTYYYPNEFDWLPSYANDTVTINLIWSEDDPNCSCEPPVDSDDCYAYFWVLDGENVPSYKTFFDCTTGAYKDSVLLDISSSYNYKTVKIINGDGDFSLKFKLHGLYTRVSYEVEYTSGISEDIIDLPLPGLRVKQVGTYSLNSPPLVKSYNYKAFTKEGGKLNYSINTSSNIVNRDNAYAQRFVTKYQCGLSCCNVHYHAFSSNSRFNLNAFQGNPIAYSCITEQQGEAFIASSFGVSIDQLGFVVVGDESFLQPSENTGWNNGLELRQFYGTKNLTDYNLAKEKSWDYDATYTLANNNIQVFKKYGGGCNSASETYAPYTLTSYNLWNIWHKLNSSTVINYFPGDNDSYNTFLQTTNYEYNSDDKLLSGIEYYNSKGEKIERIINRPTYMANTVGYDPNGVYLGMVNKHIISPTIVEKEFNNNTLISVKRANYFQPYNNIFVPESIEEQTYENPPVTLVNYLEYDENGNPLAVLTKSNLKECYHWGYNNHLPVARLTNIDYSVIENDINGLRTELDKLENYTDLSNETIRVLLREVNNLIRQKAPVEVLVTTYTYSPLIGMTSQTDPNGITTYYEYDDFGRLIRTKDNDGNILQEQNYHYKDQ